MAASKCRQEDQNQGAWTDTSPPPRVLARNKEARRNGRPGGLAASFSSIRTVTVGPGLAPGLLTPLPDGAGARGLPEQVQDTAGGELHPALRTSDASLPQAGRWRQPVRDGALS